MRTTELHSKALCFQFIFLQITQSCKISQKGKELNKTEFTYGLFLARAIYR